MTFVRKQVPWPCLGALSRVRRCEVSCSRCVLLSSVLPSVPRVVLLLCRVLRAVRLLRVLLLQVLLLLLLNMLLNLHEFIDRARFKLVVVGPVAQVVRALLLVLLLLRTRLVLGSVLFIAALNGVLHLNVAVLLTLHGRGVLLDCLLLIARRVLLLCRLLLLLHVCVCVWLLHCSARLIPSVLALEQIPDELNVRAV